MNTSTLPAIAKHYAVVAGLAALTSACATSVEHGAGEEAHEGQVGKADSDPSGMQDVLLELADGTYEMSCDLTESPVSFARFRRKVRPDAFGLLPEAEIDAKALQEHKFESASLKYIFTIAGGTLISKTDPRASLERFNSLSFKGEAYRFYTRAADNRDVLNVPLSIEEVTFAFNAPRAPGLYREIPVATFEGGGTFAQVEETAAIPESSGRVVATYDHFASRHLIPANEFPGIAEGLRFNAVIAPLQATPYPADPLMLMDLKELTATVALPARSNPSGCVDAGSYGGGPQIICGWADVKYRTAELGCSLVKTK